MKVKDGLLALLATCVLGCSPAFQYVANKRLSDPIKTQYSNGRQLLVSEHDSISVAIIAEKLEDSYVRIAAMCKNQTQEPIDFMPEEIKVYGINRYNELVRFRIIPASEYIGEVQSSQNLAIFAQSYSDYHDEKEAGKVKVSSETTTYGTVSSNTGATYTGSISSTQNSEIRDGYARQITHEKNEARLNQKIQSFESANKALYSRLARSQTIMPDSGYGGFVMVDYEAGYQDTLIVEIPVKLYTHRFKLKRKE